MPLTQGLSRAHAVKTLAASTDTGPFLLEAANWDTWNFSVSTTGTVTGGSLLVFGTTDPGTAGTMTFWNPQPGYVQTFTSNGRWFPLIAKSAQGEAAGSIANPIILFDGTQSLQYNGSLVAVRLVANAFTGGGSIIVDCLATP